MCLCMEETESWSISVKSGFGPKYYPTQTRLAKFYNIRPLDLFLGKTGHAFIHSSTLENTESPRYFTEQPQVSSETTRHKVSGEHYHDTCFAGIDLGLFWPFEPCPPDSRSICTMVYILRHAIEKWLKALDLLLNLKLSSTT